MSLEPHNGKFLMEFNSLLRRFLNPNPLSACLKWRMVLHFSKQWFSNYVGRPTSVVLSGNEVALVGGQPGMIWGNINISNNMGYDPYLALQQRKQVQLLA
jgi:hypothetical protein